MSEYLATLIGKRVAIWCVRYTYRGRIKQVNDECVVLEDPFAVEVSGKATNNKVETEDRIPSDLMISLGSIEIVCEPAWA